MDSQVDVSLHSKKEVLARLTSQPGQPPCSQLHQPCGCTDCSATTGPTKHPSLATAAGYGLAALWGLSESPEGMGAPWGQSSRVWKSHLGGIPESSRLQGNNRLHPGTLSKHLTWLPAPHHLQSPARGSPSQAAWSLKTRTAHIQLCVNIVAPGCHSK